MENPIDIDWEQLHQVSEDDPEFELELLTMLAEDVKLHLADLHQAVVERDPVAIAHEAHYIKGASANLGVIPITAVAQQIEQLARDRVGADPAPLVEQMTLHLSHLEAYLVSKN